MEEKMKQTKLLAVFISIVLVVTLFTGCSSSKAFEKS